MKSTFIVLFWGFFFTVAHSQVIYFNQNFENATTSSQTPFESENSPTVGQFNYLTNVLINTTGEKYLKFIGNNSICRATRSTAFSPTPSTLYVQFSMRASSIGAENLNAVEFYFGDGANFDNSTAPPISPVMSIKFGVNTPSTLIIQGAPQLANSFISVTLFINNSNGTMSYNDGVRSGLVNAKKYDLYVGTTLISNDLPLDNLDGNLTKFKIQTKSITGSPTLDFDNFIIKNDFIQLSSALTSFKAQSVETHKVALSWETATEINSDYFVLERSRDNINYAQISKIKAAGESSNKTTYQFVDETPSFGTNYYRLKLIATDKKEQFFPPQSVVISDANVSFGVFPNPIITPEFYVKVENSEESELSLFDFNGRSIAFEKSTITDTILKVIPSEGLNLGIYVLKVKTTSAIKEHKVIVFK